MTGISKSIRAFGDTTISYLSGLSANIQVDKDKIENIYPGSRIPEFIVTQNGDKNAISLDGVSWKLVNAPTNSTFFAAYGKGVLVSVSSFTSNSYLSADGIYWSKNTLPSSSSWSGVTYGDGVFVAVTRSNIAATSTDGITWTSRTLSSTANWGPIAFGNGRFVTITKGTNGSSVSVSSTSGSSWTARSMPAERIWQAITYGNGLFVAVASSTSTAATSTDGVTWTTRSLPSSSSWQSITYGNGVFLAVTWGTAAAGSTNGTTWQSITLPAVPDGGSWGPCVYANGLFVISGWYSSYGLRSSDGLSGWSLFSLGQNADWRSITAVPRTVEYRVANGEIQEAITNAYYVVGKTDKWLNFALGQAGTVVLPNPGLNKNRELIIKNTTSFAVTSASANVKPLNSQTAGTAILAATAGKYAKIVSDGNHWIIMEAN